MSEINWFPSLIEPVQGSEQNKREIKIYTRGSNFRGITCGGVFFRSWSWWFCDIFLMTCKLVNLWSDLMESRSFIRLNLVDRNFEGVAWRSGTSFVVGFGWLGTNYEWNLNICLKLGWVYIQSQVRYAFKLHNQLASQIYQKINLRKAFQTCISKQFNINIGIFKLKH